MNTDPRIEAAAVALFVEAHPSTRKPEQWPDVKPHWQKSYRDSARAALAAGDKAATITTTEEVWAMPTDSDVRDATDEVYERRRRGWQTIGSMAEYTSDAIQLPARVIHRGTE